MAMSETAKFDDRWMTCGEDLPPFPVVDRNTPDIASVRYSSHRTRLSTHRTALSERRAMRGAGTIHAESTFPFSFTFLVAFALLAVGVAAAANTAFHFGPFE
jgi:hypothetical protein